MVTSILASISRFCGAFLNLVYPQNCLVCESKIDALKTSPICPNCTGKISLRPVGFELKSKEFAFDRAYYATTYEDVIKKCVCLFKYEGKTQLAGPLGRLISNFTVNNVNIDDIDMIVPVPLHPVKLRQRQFNQSELLASFLAKKMNKQLVRNGARRIRYTHPQTELDREQRLNNVKGAFAAVKRFDFRAKTILLVDDVLTTGATLHECAKALKSAGAKEVIAVTLTRGN